MESVQTGSWSELLRGRNGLRSLALAGGVALHATSIFVVTTILPSVVRDIGGLDYYAWNMTLFVVGSILGSALSPSGIRVFGLRHTFLLGIVLFALGSTLAALAPAMPMLLGGRLVQGLGGGMLLSMSYTAVRTAFHESLWPRAMVLVSSMWGVSTLAGPAIGGIFAQLGHWRLAFWSMLPCALLLAVLVSTQLPRGRADEHEGPPAVPPLGRIALLAVSVMLVSLAGLSSSLVIQGGGLLAGLGITLLVARLDRHSANRLFPEDSYSPFSVLGSLYACICFLSIGVTTELYIPYFLQELHRLSPLMAGYWAALMSAGWTVGAFISSGRSPTMVNRLFVGGPLVSAASLLVLAAAMPASAEALAPWGGSKILVLPLLGVGLGIGLCWPNLLTRVFTAAPKGQENLATAGVTTLQLYAMACGAALAGMITNAAGLTNPGGDVGARAAALALFALFAASPALATVLSGGARRHVRR